MPNLTNVTAAILAGGLGTRLRSVVADRPKVLAEVRGRPFLTYLLAQLAAAGGQEVVLCTGYLGDQVPSTLGDSYGHMRLLYSQETSPLGTAGALRQARSLFRSKTVLVMNGDSYCEADLSAFWAWHHSRGAEATLLLAHVPDVSRFGQVHTDPDGQVLRFEEKGGQCEPGWINAGLYLIGHRLLESIPPCGAASLEREIFPAWVGRGLYGHRSEGRFLDIGTPEAFAQAEQFFGSEAPEWHADAT